MDFDKVAQVAQYGEASGKTEVCACSCACDTPVAGLLLLCKRDSSEPGRAYCNVGST